MFFGDSVNDRPPLSEKQLQQLCSWECPAVKKLAFALHEDASAAALAPLLQLSVLTCLHVWHCSTQTAPAGDAGAAVPAESAGNPHSPLLDISLAGNGVTTGAPRMAWHGALAQWSGLRPAPIQRPSAAAAAAAGIAAQLSGVKELCLHGLPVLETVSSLQQLTVLTGLTTLVLADVSWPERHLDDTCWSFNNLVSVDTASWQALWYHNICKQYMVLFV